LKKSKTILPESSNQKHRKVTKKSSFRNTKEISVDWLKFFTNVEIENAITESKKPI